MGKEKHFVFHQGSWKIVGVERPFSKKSRILFFFFFFFIRDKRLDIFVFKSSIIVFSKYFIWLSLFFFFFKPCWGRLGKKSYLQKKLFNVFIIQNIFRCSRVQFLSHAPSFVFFHCLLIFLFGKLHPCF